nr:transglycosylase family protein [Streptomyces ficellus]
MTGSAIALPLLGAGSASAADAATWDRVAECESGGMWSADLGNGFYGGLQMSQETWESYGGLTHAARPDLASRTAQIAVAEKVYAATGVKAWETCAPIAGLGGAAGSTTADPTAPSAGATEAAPEASDPTETLEGPDAPAAPRPSDDPVGSLLPGQPEPSAPATPQSPAPGTGKHRGEAAKEETPGTEPAAPATPGAPASSTPATPAEPAAPAASGDGSTATPTAPTEPGNSGNGREADGHPSRGDGASRDPGSVEPGAYTVRPGDNLWTIADENEVPGGWPALYEANKDAVGGDPDLIVPGQSLELTADQP